MSSPTSPFTDHASPILAGDPAISDEQRADLWDAFHSKNPDELVQHLQPLSIPDDTKQRLFEAKKRSALAGEPIDKTAAAIHRMTQIDPKALELAESHPNVLRAFTSAADKSAGDASGAPKSTSKGKPASGDQKAAPLALPPRADGLDHLPPIPEGHHRVMASDGGIHDIPAENVSKAFEIDPRLHVLNP